MRLRCLLRAVKGLNSTALNALCKAQFNAQIRSAKAMGRTCANVPCPAHAAGRCACARAVAIETAGRRLSERVNGRMAERTGA